jgi:hypothetical protein
MNDIFIIGASNSSEIAILGRTENSWKTLSINEEFRPSLPLSKSDDEDTGPVGIALDYSLALNDDPQIISQNLSDPILFLLNTDGVLSAYKIVSTRRIGKFTRLLKPRPLPVSSYPQETLIATTSISLSSKPILGSSDSATFAQKTGPILTPFTTAAPSQNVPPFPKPPASASLGFGFGTGTFQGAPMSITSKPPMPAPITDQKEGKVETSQTNQASVPKFEIVQSPRLPNVAQPVGGQMIQPSLKITPFQIQPTSDKSIMPSIGSPLGKPGSLTGIDHSQSFPGQ